MADGGVRAARGEDAAAIAGVQAAGWRSTYEGVLPVEVLAAWGDEAAVRSWASAIGEAPTPRHQVLVATENTTVVGFAATVPAGDADLDPSADLELQAVCVGPPWRGRGHGSRLVNAVGDLAAAAAVERIGVWVSEQEEALSRLLCAAGWAEDGASRTLDLRGDGQVLVRQMRLLTRIGPPS